METYNYDPNDLGFLYNNNELSHWVGGSFEIFNPTGPFNQFRRSLYINHIMLQNPNEFSTLSMNINTFMEFRDFTYAGFFLELSPFQSYDYFEAREPGWVWNLPQYAYVHSWVSTDYRNPLAVDFRIGLPIFAEMDAGPEYFSDYKMVGVDLGFSPRWRVNNHLNFIYEIGYENRPKDLGWVNKLGEDTIVPGQRNLTTIENSIRSSYFINNVSFFDLTFRHYWSKADYANYMRLDESGYMTYILDYSENHNVNFNVWNVDFSYTWWFASGSQMTILWHQQIGSFNDYVDLNYMDNLDQLWNEPQRNTFSVRFLYYLDYNQLRRKDAQGRERN